MNERRYYSLRFLGSNAYHSKDEVLNEEFEYRKKGKTSAMDEVLKESQNGTIRF